MHYCIKSSIGTQGEDGRLFKCFEHPVVYSTDRSKAVVPVSLTLCCFVVYSTRIFVLSLALCYFVLVFFSPFSIAITSLGEETADLNVVRTFVRYALVWFCLFSLPLGVREGLWLVIVVLPGLFSYHFFKWHRYYSVATARS